MRSLGSTVKSNSCEGTSLPEPQLMSLYLQGVARYHQEINRVHCCVVSTSHLMLTKATKRYARVVVDILNHQKP